MIAGVLREGQKAYEGPFDVMGQMMLIRRKNAAYGAEQMVKTGLEQILIILIRSSMETREEITEKETANDLNRTRIIDAVLAILSENLYQDIHLDDVCQATAFSRSYVERLFYEEMGCGIKQYFTKMKVERAKEMISEQQYTFTEIASKLGFNSVHYFSRTFKKHTDMSPSQYQQSVLKITPFVPLLRNLL